MKFYNVHIVHQNELQKVLNAHAAKGYEIRWLRNAGGPLIQVVFEQDAEARLKRKSSETVKAEAIEQPALETV